MEDYEILVIDNCSTDDSVVIVKQLKNEFANLELVENQENIEIDPIIMIVLKLEV